MYLIRQILFGLVGLLACEVALAQVPGASSGGGRGGLRDAPVPAPEPGQAGCAFDYCVADYDNARAQAGALGETLEIINSDRAGGFDWSSTDPYSNGDDSTLVLVDGSGGFWVRDFAHVEGDPILIKWYEPVSQNDTLGFWFDQMLSGIGAADDHIHIKAEVPSGVDTLYTNFHQFGDDYGLETVGFYEGSTALDIVFTGLDNSGTSRNTMWRFRNARWIKIGGTNLNLTFTGTSPGLGTTTDHSQNFSMFLVWLQDSGLPHELMDFRANIRDAISHGLNVLGGNTTTDRRFDQVNVSGQMWNSGGLRINGGAHVVWYDPDNLKVQDPYNRHMGWDGGSATTYSGDSGTVNVGCYDDDIREPRLFNTCPNNADKITGGITLEYGAPHCNLFTVNEVGNSENDPFVVSYKDLGASGPNADTGLPEGVVVKKSADWLIMKHDPASTPDFNIPNKRFVQFVELEPDFQNGLFSNGITTSLCDAGNSNPCGGSCTFSSGWGSYWRAEASRDGVASQYLTSFMTMLFGTQRESRWVNVANQLGIGAAGSGADDSPGPATPDRTWGHVIKVAAGDSIRGVGARDSVTVTGGGVVYNNINMTEGTATPNSTTIDCEYNEVIDVTVGGVISVGANCNNTKVEGVTFSASSQAVMTIASGADVTVPVGAGNGLTSSGSGATITGAGTLTCNGSGVSLPYDFDTDSACEY